MTPANFDPAPGWGGFFHVLGLKHFSPFKTYVNRKHRTVVVLNPKVGTKSFRQALTDGMREVYGIKDPSEGRYRLLKKAVARTVVSRKRAIRLKRSISGVSFRTISIPVTKHRRSNIRKTHRRSSSF